MKSLIVVAGLIGAVGVLTAAPASAQGSSVACAPAILCHIVGIPGQAAEDIATAPGRAVPGHRDGAGTRVPEHRDDSGTRCTRTS